jgi:hypothetical protein
VWQYLGPELRLATMHRWYLEKCKQEKIAAKYIGKEWVYQKFFNENFKLGFKGPFTITCDNCDSLLMQLKEATMEKEKKKIKMKNDNCIRKMLQTVTTLKGRIRIYGSLTKQRKML